MIMGVCRIDALGSIARAALLRRKLHPRLLLCRRALPGNGSFDIPTLIHQH